MIPDQRDLFNEGGFAKPGRLRPHQLRRHLAHVRVAGGPGRIQHDPEEAEIRQHDQRPGNIEFHRRQNVHHPPGVVNDGRKDQQTGDIADQGADQRRCSGIDQILPRALRLRVAERPQNADLAALFIHHAGHRGQADQRRDHEEEDREDRRDRTHLMHRILVGCAGVVFRTVQHRPLAGFKIINVLFGLVQFGLGIRQLLRAVLLGVFQLLPGIRQIDPALFQIRLFLIQRRPAVIDLLLAVRNFLIQFY